jgi:DNA-binding GntR family transcriptional regulator
VSSIDTRSLVDRVYEYVLERIVTGRIKYGQTISIKRLAEELEISTMPVREAIKRLQYEKIVDIKPRSNCQVLIPSPRMIAEVYALRELLERHALEKAATGPIDPERLRNLEAIVAQMATVPRINDAEERERKAVELDLAFHAALCRLAGNSYMDAVFDQLMLHVNMTLIHERAYRKLEDSYYDSHAGVLKHLRTDPRTAGELLQRHFDNVRSVLLGSNSET